MTLPTPLAIPGPWQKRYLISRIALYLLIFIVTVFFVLNVLFPVIVQEFDFRSPQSSRNTLLSPRSPEHTPRINGKLEAGGTMIADTSVVGDFSLATATATLERDSAIPERIELHLRRSYQSFFYPTGTPVTDFPEETTYRVADTYYALRDGTLFPYVSAQAYLSRFPEESALPADETLLDAYPVSEEWLGFRVGSLLGNATGVFIVTSETEARPIGSADIFLALGYDFENVIPVNEEELGTYKRGRIVLLGAAHPDGTVLFDQDTGAFFLVDQGTKRPLLAGPYRDFLTAEKRPITVSTRASEQVVSCTPVPNIFGTKLSCATPITTLSPGFGNDFRLELTTPETMEIKTLALAFETAKNRQNMLTLLSQVKQRLLARFLP